MELDELKSAWQRLDQRVEEIAALTRRSWTGTVTRRARWRLAPMLLGSVLNIIAGLIFAVMCGAFWSAHLDKPGVVVAGMTLHLASIGLVVIGAVRLALILQVDYTQPVLEIQRSLAKLQQWETRSFLVAWLGSWLVVTAAMMIAVAALTGFDLWQIAPSYVLMALAVSLAGGLAPWLLHRWAQRRGGRLAAWFDAFMLNHNIARASAAIAEIDDFARDRAED
jgi:hypothetical protein